MIRKLAAGTALAAALTVGSVGVASAAPATTSPGAAHPHFTCADAPWALARIGQVEHRIGRVEHLRDRLTHLQSRIETRCPAGTSSSGSPSTGSTSAA